jgi:hypothetical protein
MKERRGGVKGSGARRQLVAAALVLAAPACVLTIGVLDETAGAWIYAAVAALAALVVLGAAPRRGRSAPAWGLLGLGMLFFAGGLLGGASS